LLPVLSHDGVARVQTWEHILLQIVCVRGGYPLHPWQMDVAMGLGWVEQMVWSRGVRPEQMLNLALMLMHWAL
jgi:hypothetical protein